MVDAYDKNGNKLDGIFKKDKTNKPEGEILINLKQKYFINSKKLIKVVQVKNYMIKMESKIDGAYK